KFQEFSRLFDRQAAEVSQFNNLTFARVLRSQLFQSLIEGEQFLRPRLSYPCSFIQCYSQRAAATLERTPFTRMVNHDPPHQLRGWCDEVRPVLPRRLRVFNQSQVSFVEDRGGLQGVAGALPAHVMVSQPVQFGLHQRKQLLERPLVSSAPVTEQLSNLLS